MRKTPSRFRPGDLADPSEANEALAHWDELDPRDLAALEADPHHAARLGLLRSAERWLGGDAGPGDCPSSDELYDFGRGPGYTPLSAAHRAAIDLHLERCGDCELLVETLASPPPLPLDLAPPADPHEHEVAPPAPALVPARGRWIPLATAAALLATASVWMIAREPTHAGLPAAELLRGDEGGALLHPRERLLARSAALVAAFPACARPVRFEIEPVPGASAYRIEIARHAGGAFERARPFLSRAGAAPTFEVDAALLEPGAYTWSAAATADGLDQPLGERDFEVVVDAELESALVGLARTGARDERTLAAIRLFDERGFASEARALARDLAPSSERDAWLERPLGR